jgi:hypothetical protein
VNSTAARSYRPSITAWPTPEEKQRFAALATSRGTSESRLALIAIRAVLESNEPTSQRTAPTLIREPASDRITVRLRPGDRRAIADRAQRRGMKGSAYLAALVRAHVGANPPLAADELAALKQAVVVLAALGRLLSRIARGATQTGVMSTDLQQRLSQTRTVVAALEQRTHDLARAALVSWESPL